MLARERARRAARRAYEYGRLRAATRRAGVATLVLVVAEHQAFGVRSVAHAAVFFAMFVFLDWRGCFASAVSLLRRVLGRL
ncbi:MAG: hypothetical protein JST00_06735 [Deltaproteobacteria bacterium]|nr:hypothetical protein [Deltaproteobacteria bacterium]